MLERPVPTAAAFVVYLGVLYHAASSWYFVAPGVFLYAIDRAIRFANGARLPTVSLVPRGGATTIEFRYVPVTVGGSPKALLHTAGQYW